MIKEIKGGRFLLKRSWWNSPGLDNGIVAHGKNDTDMTQLWRKLSMLSLQQATASFSQLAENTQNSHVWIIVAAPPIHFFFPLQNSTISCRAIFYKFTFHLV